MQKLWGSNWIFTIQKYFSSQKYYWVFNFKYVDIHRLKIIYLSTFKMGESLVDKSFKN